MTHIASYLAIERKKSVVSLAGFLDTILPAYSKFDPTFIPVAEEIREYLLAGGKMHRPTLTRLAFAVMAGRKPNDQEVKASLCIEILHRFILCHDDIVDRDFTRHGRPTLERVFFQEQVEEKWAQPLPQYGQVMAMIAGDLIHSMAFELIGGLRLDPLIKVELIKGLHECLIETAAGWRLETILKQKTLREVSEIEVKKAMMLVSAQYSVVWPLRIGQLLAGKRMGEWSDTLEEYGTRVGLCFQLQDDMLGIMGKAEEIGKPVGGDIREGKKTLLLLRAYKKGTALQKQLIEKLLGTDLSQEEVTQIQEVLIQTGRIDWAMQELSQQVQQVIELLEQTDTASGESVARLKQLAVFLAERTK